MLNEARENLEGMIDELRSSSDGEKPRTYRRNARADYLSIARKKHKTKKEIRKAIGKQLNYVRRDLGIIDGYLALGRELPDKRMERLRAIHALFGQQLYMHRNRSNQVPNRIVSLSQHWVRPIVRGKARVSCEFGAKLDISVADNFTRLEHTSFDAYNESGNLTGIIERYRERTGHYPGRVLADKIFRTRDNIMFCQSKGIHISGKPLGRPRKDEAIDKKLLRKEEIDRIEVERKFSHAKGSFGLGLIKAKLKDTSKTAIALAMIALNIAYIARIFRGFSKISMDMIFCMIKFISYKRKLAFVQ